MLNTLPIVSAGRIPRGLIKVNGSPITGWEEFETEENEYSAPDTFSVKFATFALPDAMNAAWWAAQGDADVEIFAGFPSDPDAFTASDLETIFAGKVDDVTFDWTTSTMTVKGRDLTAPLIDHKTSEKYVNLTSSQIAGKLAAKYGLTPVITSTSTMVGRFYQIDHVDLKDDRTEWDLLTWLAREEGFVTYVRGKELHFEPRPDGKGNAYVVQWVAPGAEGGAFSGNFTSFQNSRSLTVAKDIEVTVRSWNSKSRRAFIKTSKRKGAAGGVQKYSYTIPNLSQDEAQKKADQFRDEISKHEMKLSFEGPADNTLHINSVIQQQGTGTNFDQTYFPESITRTMSLEEGYVWSVQAKNHATESQATI